MAAFRNEPPAQARPRALAIVDAQIPEAEGNRDRWLKVVKALTDANRQCRREKAMLRWAGLANDWLVDEIECGTVTGTGDCVFALRASST